MCVPYPFIRSTGYRKEDTVNQETLVLTLTSATDGLAETFLWALTCSLIIKHRGGHREGS